MAKQRASERGQEEHLRVLKRGAPIFVAAITATILRERNGPNYARKLTREKAGSRNTRERLDKYAQIATTWYVDVVIDLIASGIELTTLLRSPELYKRVDDKILGRWDVQQASKAWVDDALPKM